VTPLNLGGKKKRESVREKKGRQSPGCAEQKRQKEGKREKKFSPRPQPGKKKNQPIILFFSFFAGRGKKKKKCNFQKGRQGGDSVFSSPRHRRGQEKKGKVHFRPISPWRKETRKPCRSKAERGKHRLKKKKKKGGRNALPPTLRNLHKNDNEKRKRKKGSNNHN